MALIRGGLLTMARPSVVAPKPIPDVRKRLPQRLLRSSSQIGPAIHHSPSSAVTGLYPRILTEGYSLLPESERPSPSRKSIKTEIVIDRAPNGDLTLTPHVWETRAMTDPEHLAPFYKDVNPQAVYKDYPQYLDVPIMRCVWGRVPVGWGGLPYWRTYD